MRALGDHLLHRNYLPGEDYDIVLTTSLGFKAANVIAFRKSVIAVAYNSAGRSIWKVRFRVSISLYSQPFRTLPSTTECTSHITCTASAS
jgi:hypothetical protein